MSIYVHPHSAHLTEPRHVLDTLLSSGGPRGEGSTAPALRHLLFHNQRQTLNRRLGCKGVPALIKGCSSSLWEHGEGRHWLLIPHCQDFGVCFAGKATFELNLKERARISGGAGEEDVVGRRKTDRSSWCVYRAVNSLVWWQSA